ncbi:hypothetical protein [Gluconobacter sp. DsW_058]|uniref:hypothetical protein n=1 Tax=Gluconobacter sp. DsW_058 TaxID=1511210 RepID=UPI000A39C56D|nr:hypothetical protein [Gluconobacter sp. DsW_058]OUJ09316.1 hypothetical protein HK24_00715 [Gluconobacter sp. DsW_058]
MRTLRRALASFAHSEFDTVCLERDQAQQRADTMAKTVANQALEIVTLQARLARLTSTRDADGRFMKRNPT